MIIDKFMNQELKRLILDNYPSIKDFASEHDFEYRNLVTMLNKDLGNAKVKHVLKICSILDIDLEKLILSHEISPNTQQIFDGSNIGGAGNVGGNFTINHNGITSDAKHNTDDVIIAQKIALDTQHAILETQAKILIAKEAMLKETTKSNQILKDIFKELQAINKS